MAARALALEHVAAGHVDRPVGQIGAETVGIEAFPGTVPVADQDALAVGHRVVDRPELGRSRR